MATSGSFKTSGYNGRHLVFSWTETSQSTENNTTTISWTLKGAGTAPSGYYMTGNIKLVIDGTTVYSRGRDDRFELYNGTTVATGTHTLTHDDEGDKSFTVSAQAGIYTFAVNCTGSATFTLDNIARASQPSLITWPETTNDVGNFGATISIHMNRNSDAFTHTVRYAFGSLTGIIATGVTTGTTWTIPLSFMDLLPAATSGSGLIYVDTYNGSQLVGTKYTGFTAKVPASVKPTLSVALTDTTAAGDLYGSPVIGLSRIKIVATGKEAYSSPITYKITANGETFNTATATTSVLNGSSSRVQVTATDARGRSASYSYDMTLLPYSAPAVSALTVHRCDEGGAANDRGEYVKVTFSAAVSSMSSKNTASYTLKYKKTSATAWTSVSLSALTNKYAVSDYEYILAADGSSAYDISITATDLHGAASRSTSASTAFTLINFHGSGTALRFGGVAQKENTLTNSLSLQQEGNTYASQSTAFVGVKGYNCMAAITLTGVNVNAPIVFTLNKRHVHFPMTVYVRFSNSSDTVDVGLSSIDYDGANYGAFLVKTATATWKLYVDNTDGWSNPCVQSWYTTESQSTKLTVTFPDEIVEGTVPSVLGTYYRAVPAKMQSLLDYIYPVGSIYLSYSHVSPETLFGGTWVRIENAFLWAVDSSGQIGLTGGEKTVALTTAQMPAHSHGSVYSQHASGTKDKAWYNTSGSAVAYGAVETGGGQAHNNMPPYIQVSVWRRTA